MHAFNMNHSFANKNSSMLNFVSQDSFLPSVGSFTSLPPWLYHPFVIISIVESLLGIVGNSLVIVVISCVGKSNLQHRSYNSFIVNLALSDLVLSLFTTPLNTYRTLNIYMTFPPALCKLADSFPAINVYVSSLTIVAISVHRYLVVCFPHKKFMGTFATFLTMIGIWLLAIGAASPLFVYSVSSQVYDDVLLDVLANISCPEASIYSCFADFYKKHRGIHVCYESWPQYGNWRLIYTIFMFFLQFILPISIICITYYQVMLKLRERFRYRFLLKRHNIASLRYEVRRQRRNNVLLLLIVASYAISWLPFNISYTIFTYASRYQNSSDGAHAHQMLQTNDFSKYLPLRFLICMISAIANPFLYGYFNETFRDGLKKIFSQCCPHLSRVTHQIYYEQADTPAFSHQNGKVSTKLDQLSLLRIHPKDSGTIHPS